MEIIRIPQVSLVDGTGRKIGVYDDDPDWWQQLKLKQRNKNLMKIVSYESLKTDDETERKHNISENIEMCSSSVKLIDNDNEYIRKNQNFIDTYFNDENSAGEEFDRRDQCNVIGETPLHIAIMYDDLNTIRHLIEKRGINVNQRSIDGKFCGGFNSSKTTAKCIQESKYEGLAYYGEYPLALAACFSNKEIYDYLIDQGADPNLRDSNGNTLLHVLVINDKLDMFLYASNHPKTKAHSNIKNAQELTPTILAAKLGREEIFTKMLEVNVMKIWSYSNITCSAYPLEGIDTVSFNGTLEKNSALSFIVNGETDSHLDMLRIGVIERLLEDKWSTYAERMFYKKLSISVIHLIFLSIAVYTRAEDSDQLLRYPETAATWARYISETCVVLICIYTIYLQIKELYTQGFKEYVLNQYGEPANVLSNFFCIFVLLAVPFRFVSFEDTRSFEDTFIILAVPCGWMHLLLYARVFKITGPFVVMIYKMIIGDIFTFATIYLVLLFGFSMGFYYLYKNAGSDVTTMNDFVEAVMITFQMTLGEFKLVEFDQIYYNDFTKIIFVVFMILMHILLLNMLIAMMGNTYHQIISKSEKEWRRQRAHIVILLERSFSSEELLKFQNKYCIKKPNKGKPDIVALMVIKRIANTKASKKQNSIRLWLKLYKLVKSDLKNNNSSAVELLEIWKNKEALSKVKIKKVRKTFDWSKYANKKKVPSTNNIQPIDMPLLGVPSATQPKTTSQQSEALKSNSELYGSESYDTKTTTINEKTINTDGTSAGLMNENSFNNSLSTPKRIYYPMSNNGLYPSNSSFSLTGNTRYSKYSDFFDRRPLSNRKKDSGTDTQNNVKGNFLPKFPSHKRKARQKTNHVDNDNDDNDDDPYNIDLCYLKSPSFHYQSN